MSKNSRNTGRVVVYKLKDFLDLSNVKIQKCEFAGADTITKSAVEYSLWIINPKAKEPKWFGPIKDITNKSIKTRHAGYILLVNKEKSTYAFVAGIGYHKLLKEYEIETGFGINVAKSIINKPSNIKALGQRDVIGNEYSLDRSFRSKYIPDRDIDNLHRILKQLKACMDKESEEYKTIGASITASDSLSVSGSKNFDQMIEFLDKVDTLYKSNKQLISIPGISKIGPKKQKVLIPKLYEALSKTIIKSYSSKPEIGPQNLFLDNYNLGYLPSRISQYHIHIGRERNRFDTPSDVFAYIGTHLKNLNASNKNSYYMDQMNKIKIAIELDDGEILDKTTIIKYICGDIKYKNDNYFIDSGEWHKVDSHHIKMVDEQLDRVKYMSPEELHLKEWNSNREDEYNRKQHNKLVVLDKGLIKIESERGGIEFCDLYLDDNDNKYLIHVKKGNGANLRELFAQGMVSAELYARDSEYRNNIHNSIFTKHIDLKPDVKNALAALEDLDISSFTLVFAIYDDKISHVPRGDSLTQRLHGTLTLFAKIDLFSRVQSIRELGMNVAVTRIGPYPKKK